MAKSSDAPENLRPYIFHGVDLQWRSSDKEATGTCPWCNSDGKFSVNIQSGMWRCLRCNEGTANQKAFQGGNSTVFLRKLWEMSYDSTTVEARKQLATDRKLLFPESVIEWQFATSILSGKWLLPGYNAEGKITQLYQWIPINNRMAWLLTPTMGHKIFGGHLYDANKDSVILCEGIWDAVALYEVMRRTKISEDQYVVTSNPEVSMLTNYNILATPSAEVFFEAWLPFFSGKKVLLFGQNDHPKKHPTTGADIPPASLGGMQRIAQMLLGSPNPPSSIELLYWGELGYTKDLVHGYDVRDHLAS